jgi:hypothetical protein
MHGRSQKRFAMAGMLSAAAVVSCGLRPALAIPEAEATKKLSVIPVFIVADDKGNPLPIPREKALLLPLYLDREQAEKELANARKANPNLKAQLLPVPLNAAQSRIAEVNKTLPDRKVVAAVVPSRRDREQAIQLLRRQGLDDKAIRDGLVLPVFFTRPFITVKTPQGERALFFLDYASMEQALSRIPERSKLQPQAADITAVMAEIIKQPKDNYAFFPTPEYFRLLDQQSRQGSRSPAPANR